MATSAEVLINKFLELAEEKGVMPWEQPYNMHKCMNYVSMKGYSGFNALILPPGEYLTKKQINDYNKKNETDFRYQKGIRWYPISYFERKVEPTAPEKMPEKAKEACIQPQERYQEFYKDGMWVYYVEDFKYFRYRVVLTWYQVAERSFLKDSEGNYFPSRFEENAVEITLVNPNRVVEDYLAREGLEVIPVVGTPAYSPSRDIIKMNKEHNSEDEYFCSLFHEMAHSTGAKHRLNRNIGSKSSSEYAKEECIAEITAALLCGESGINSFSTSNSREFKNSAAYFNFYKERIRDWGKEFIYIVSSAEKAFNYILGNEV